jgi:hypothetical protein
MEATVVETPVLLPGVPEEVQVAQVVGKVPVVH